MFNELCCLRIGNKNYALLRVRLIWLFLCEIIRDFKVLKLKIEKLISSLIFIFISFKLYIAD